MSITITGNSAVKTLTNITAQGFGHHADGNGLRLAEPKIIRAGKHGGLPFDALSTDLFNGCLPAKAICYGECFAAKQAFNEGIDFGRRVKNIFDEQVFTSDLSKLPSPQGFVRSGWNSDTSWDWNGQEALGIMQAIHGAGKHPVILTKAFTKLDEERMQQFAEIGTEIRVCVSAFDTDAQLNHRINTMLEYRAKGGLGLPVVMSAKFKNQALNERQDQLVRALIEHDLPAAENSIRFNPKSPVLSAIDTSSCGIVDQSGDLWAGRLYPEQLIVPTLSSVPSSYTGVDPYRSKNDRDFLASIFADPVPTNRAILESDHSLSKPACAGVPKSWAATP